MESIGSYSSGFSASIGSLPPELDFDPDMSALPMAQRYRKYGKRLDKKTRRKLLQQVVQALMRQSKSIVTSNGVITKRTEILPYLPGKDLDLDLSVDNIIGNLNYKLPTYRDLVRREIIRPKRLFVILADKSNSLGPTIDYVAMAVSILAEAVQGEDYAVLFFDEYVKTVKAAGDFVSRSDVLEEIMEVECKGATDLKLGFIKAKEQMDSVKEGTDTICVVISDCIHTCEGNPLEIASLFPRMEILLVQNKGIIIGRSSVDKLEKLPNVKVKEIHDLNDIIDSVQRIVSFDEMDFVVE